MNCPTQSPLNSTWCIIEAIQVCAEVIMPRTTRGLACSRCSINISDEEATQFSLSSY